MGSDRKRLRLIRRARRLDRIATYGLPEPRRIEELVDRAGTLEELASTTGEGRLVRWKLRSTIFELGRRVLIESRSDPSTLPAACRILVVAISTGVLSALSFTPDPAWLAVNDHVRLTIFNVAQLVVGPIVVWYVIALVRHPDHFPLRNVAAPSAIIGVCMVIQAATNQPQVLTDHLYTISASITAVGSFGVAAAATGTLPHRWARVGLRCNAFAAGLTGINVFYWVSHTFGFASLASAVQVGAIVLGVNGTLMLTRLPWRWEVPRRVVTRHLPILVLPAMAERP